MKGNFNDCLNRVLRDEGGYTNDPNDNGGPTNYGITLADYKLYINKKGTAVDVKNMSVDQAKIIYKTKYWDALDCDNLSSGVDYTVFDYGVNSGLGRPRKALGKFKSLEGTKLIDAINDERIAFLQAIGVGHNSKFLKGWLGRVSRVRSYSTALASKDNVTGPVIGTATVAAGSLVSTYWHNHQMLIIAGAVAVAIAIGTAIHFYLNKGKQ